MNDKILVDTNLWVYLYSKDPATKYKKVRNLVDKNFDTVIARTQILGELYNTLIKKNYQTKE